MNIALVFGLYRLSAYQFDEAEEKSSAVETGYRKKIEDTYIYADECAYIEQLEKSIRLILALFGSLADSAYNTNRT